MAPITLGAQTQLLTMHDQALYRRALRTTQLHLYHACAYSPQHEQFPLPGTLHLPLALPA